MNAILYIALVPISVGGMAMYLRIRNKWLRFLGLTMFGAGLFLLLLLPAVWRGLSAS